MITFNLETPNKMDIDEMEINTHELPSLDYQLNVCLVSVAMEITDEDLHVMKYLLRGNASLHVVLDYRLSITYHVYEV